MQYYWKIRVSTFSGSSYSELYKKAIELFNLIRRNPKRKVFVRSKYFKKQKIHFYYFWDHLLEKPIKQRKQRLKYLPCAIELIKNSTYNPDVKKDKKGKNLYRFYGKLKNGNIFVVQIKDTGKRKQCISIFPWKKINLR